MIKNYILLFSSGILLLKATIAVSAGPLFNIVSTSTTGNVDITLCLNGYAQLSCQNYRVSQLNLSIQPTIPNHQYSTTGIKINTPGYAAFGCSPLPNGYCIFTASDTNPVNIVLSNLNYEMLTIGNPGNVNDDETGYGVVDYTYKIGKYKVTIAQYVQFLNAIASADTYEVYQPQMGLDLNIAGIKRAGTSGNYTYSVMENQGNSANRPISYISWLSAARFANWMANGMPSGTQSSTTTEDGAYTLNGAMDGLAVPKNSINPNTGAPPTFYIPTENEWYKAAYYSQELNGGNGGYYIYPTQSNVPPGNVIGNIPNNSNFFSGVFSVGRSATYYTTQNYLTDVGAYTASASFYGMFDMGGDQGEWNDLDNQVVPYRGSRGTYWYGGTSQILSSLWATDSISNVSANADIGFRLAGVN